MIKSKKGDLTSNLEVLSNLGTYYLQLSSEVEGSCVKLKHVRLKDIFRKERKLKMYN